MLEGGKTKRRRRLALPRSKEPEAAEGKRQQRQTAPSSDSRNRFETPTQQESPARATRGRPPIAERSTNSDIAPSSTPSTATAAVEFSNPSEADTVGEGGGTVTAISSSVEENSYFQDLRSSKARKCQRADCRDPKAAAAVAIEVVDGCERREEQGLYRGKGGVRDRAPLESLQPNARPEMAAAGRSKLSNSNDRTAIPVLSINLLENDECDTSNNNSSNGGGGGSGPDQPDAQAPDSGNGRRNSYIGKSRDTHIDPLQDDGVVEQPRPQRQHEQQLQQQQQQKQHMLPPRKRRRPIDLPASPASTTVSSSSASAPLPPPPPPRTSSFRPAEDGDGDGVAAPRAAGAAPEGGLEVEVEGSPPVSRPRIERGEAREAATAVAPEAEAAEVEAAGAAGGTAAAAATAAAGTPAVGATGTAAEGTATAGTAAATAATAGIGGGQGGGGGAGRRAVSATPERYGKSGELCPVCGSAVWGLSVRARQVHINACLDGTAPNEVVGNGADTSTDTSATGAGSSGAPSGRRLSAGVVKKPKTEFQEHIQMAKALSKSLVAAIPVATPDPENEEELARDPIAFGAKEKRLLGTLKDLDAKLERLNKDRDTALKKLAAHRALGARLSVRAGGVGGSGDGAPKTAEELVDALFPDEHTANGADLTGQGCGAARTDRDCGGGVEGEGEGDGADAGELRLIRRRTSGSGGGGAGSLSSSGGRALWTLAQDAGDLSQSNFVTGVFADVRADGRGEGGEGGTAAVDAEKETATVRTEVTAAAYGDASLYNRKPARRATIATPLSSLPVAGGGRGRHPESMPSSRRGGHAGAAADVAFERGVVVGERRPGGNELSTEGDDASHDHSGAADDAILLLSQTQSSQRPVSRVADGNSSPLTVPGAATAGGAERAAAASGLGMGCTEEEAEAATARHIARAPVAEVSAFFPDWEENVRFVFRQGEAELREALRSINAALSEEDYAVAGERAGAGVAAATATAGVRDTPGGGVHEQDAFLAEKRSRCRGGGSGKAKALLFFESVIVEALKRTASDGSPSTRPVIDHDDVNDETDGENGDDSADDEQGDGGGNGCDGAAVVREKPGCTGDPGGVHGGRCFGDAADCSMRSGIPRDEGSGGAKRKSGGDSDGESDGEGAGAGAGAGGGGGGGDGGDGVGAKCFRGDDCVDDARVDATQVDGAPVDEAVAAGAVATARAQDAAVDVGVSDFASAEEEHSDGTIVLSGDSCLDAVVTFDLSSPVARKDSAATTAAAAAAATAAETPDAEPLDYVDNGCWYSAEDDTPVGGAGRDAESTLDESRTREPARGHTSDDDTLEPQDLARMFSGDVGTAAAAATAADDDDDETLVQPASPPLSPFAKPRSLSGGWSAESEEEDEDSMLHLPASQRHAVLRPARSVAAAAAAANFVLSLPARPPPPSSSAPTICLSGSSSTSSCSPPPVVGNASPMGSGRQRAGRTSRWTGLSLTQEAPSRLHRRKTEESSVWTAAAPVRGRSQPLLGRRPSAVSASLAPPGEGPGGSSASALRGDGGGAGPLEVMPSFDRMTVQELAGMVSVYGLKKTSKKDMVLRLARIWRALHPAAAAATDDAVAATAAGVDGESGCATGNLDSSSALGSRRGRRPDEGRVGAHATSTAVSGTGSGLVPASRRPPPPASNRSVGDRGGSSQAPNQEGDEAPPSSSQQLRVSRPAPATGSSGKESLAERIRAVITRHGPLHEDILLLRTVELSTTQRLLKDEGVKCSKRDLGEYLDAKGITFIDRGTGTRRGGEDRPQKRRKKKGRPVGAEVGAGGGRRLGTA